MWYVYRSRAFSSVRFGGVSRATRHRRTCLPSRRRPRDARLPRHGLRVARCLAAGACVAHGSSLPAGKGHNHQGGLAMDDAQARMAPLAAHLSAPSAGEAGAGDGLPPASGTTATEPAEATSVFAAAGIAAPASAGDAVAEADTAMNSPEPAGSPARLQSDPAAARETDGWERTEPPSWRLAGKGKFAVTCRCLYGKGKVKTYASNTNPARGPWQDWLREHDLDDCTPPTPQKLLVRAVLSHHMSRSFSLLLRDLSVWMNRTTW